jgi:hypothetical protein
VLKSKKIYYINLNLQYNDSSSTLWSNAEECKEDFDILWEKWALAPIGSRGPWCEMEYWEAGCKTCGSNNNTDKILICDGCDAEFHMDCLVPVLTEVPPV